MAKELKPGDRVQWNSPQRKTTGTVKKKLNSVRNIKGHVARAAKANLQYSSKRKNPASKRLINQASFRRRALAGRELIPKLNLPALPSFGL